MQSFSDTLGQVFRAIAANKLRSFLTMFGIAWGVGSLLVLVGLGEGFRSGQRRNLSNLGNDLVMMWNGTIPAVANQHTGMRPYELTMGDAVAREPSARSARRHRRAQPLRSLRSEPVEQHLEPCGGDEPNYAGVRFIPMATGRFHRRCRSGAETPRGGSRLEGGQHCSSTGGLCSARPSPSTGRRLP